MVETPRVSLDGVDSVRLRAALEKATAALLAERNTRGFWEGGLSSSALSTATAVTALALGVKSGAVAESEILNLKSPITSGLRWLTDHQNPDGGWGDTTKSFSNISTTTLCWAAFGACEADRLFTGTVNRAQAWLTKNAGSIEPCQLARTIIARYGKDRTFSVPILTMCALAGRLGPERDAWRDVIPLPFELAALPHKLFAAIRLPVVSYALPALIAIGLARHVHAPSTNPFARSIRNVTREKTLRVLAEIQPRNGGFLEATPLTSFVTMSLIASGLAGHIVAQRGLEFLRKSQRTDGSWPIDTNLSTWCTTLAIEALPSAQLSALNSQSIDWLLAQQYRNEHPYTHAAPGGWAWTDLPGGVPDADDTCGALVALGRFRRPEFETRKREFTRAAEAGVRWLLNLQNRDGGIPTFCRGWGALPFDRSSADITAHTIRAWIAWEPLVDEQLGKQLQFGLKRAMRFLAKNQLEDGSHSPLWFGSQTSPTEVNKTYGTARVMLALSDWDMVMDRITHPIGRRFHLAQLKEAAIWLLKAQNSEGAWSGDLDGPASIEETALATQALAGTLACNGLFVTRLHRADAELALRRGTNWIISRVENDTWREPSPIGFYFAKLWYFEKLYPLIFTVGALRAVLELKE